MNERMEAREWAHTDRVGQGAAVTFQFRREMLTVLGQRTRNRCCGYRRDRASPELGHQPFLAATGSDWHHWVEHRRPVHASAAGAFRQLAAHEPALKRQGRRHTAGRVLLAQH